MEELKFGDEITIWKTKYNFINKKVVIQNCYRYMQKFPDIKIGYPYYDSVSSKPFGNKTTNELDNIRNFGIDRCTDLYRDEKYDRIVTDTWINIVRTETRQIIPHTEIHEHIFHAHSDINRENGKPIPHFTFVIYIQMPNNLTGNDGVLYLKDSQGNEFNFLPQEGDCIIMKGDLLHVSEYAKKSTLDRLVLAGNVTFQKSKSTTTLI